MKARIDQHPILGEPEKGRPVVFTYNGQELTGYEGEPVAAALKAAGVMVHRYTKKEHKPRGIFCAIGRCTDCVMIVDGKPNIRTCITPLREGMKVQTVDAAQKRLGGAGLKINDPHVVSKSYPHFWDEMRRAGFTITEEY